MGERERVPDPGDREPRATPTSQTIPTDQTTPTSQTIPTDQAAPTSQTIPTDQTTPTDQAALRLTHRRGQQAAELRQKLDEKATAAAELRQALDELRQVLAVDSPPPAANRRRRRARVSVLLAGTLTVAALALWLALDHESGRIVVGPPPTGPTVPESSTSSSSTHVRSMLAVPPGAATQGPGVSAPGTDVQVAITPDGRSLDVVERLVLETPTTQPLPLAVPAWPPLAAEVRVEGLRVQLGDRIMAVPGGSGRLEAGHSIAVPADGTSTRVILRYRLTRAITLVAPAAPGRALGVVAPLTGAVSLSHGHEVLVRVTGSDVLGVSCPTAGTGAVCGSRTTDGWIATVPAQARPAVVVVQLDTRR